MKSRLDTGGKKAVKKFFGKYKTVSYKKKEIILGPVSPLPFLFYIKKGFVRCYCVSEGGTEVTLHIAKPGTYFPMMLELSNKPNIYFWEAMTDVDIKKAPKEAVVSFVLNNHEVLVDLTTRFACGITGLLTRIQNLALDSAYIRLASLLYYFAKRYGEKDPKNKQCVRIKLQLTHDDLATWTALSRETVTRRIARLEKEGIIDYSARKLVIVNMKKLQKEANSSYTPRW